MSIFFKMPKAFLISFFIFTHVYAQSDQQLANDKSVLQTTMSYLMQKNKYDEALSYTKKFLAKYPDEPEALRLDGLARYSKKDFKGASTSFSKAAVKTSGEDKAINSYLLAQSRIKAGDLPGAESALVEMGKNEISAEYARLAINELRAKQAIPEFNQSMFKKTSPPAVSQAPAAKGLTANSFSQSAEIVFGLDSNPVFIPDNSETKNEAESTFFSVTSNTGYNSKFLDGEINHILSLGYSGYQKEIAKSFNNFRWGLSTSWKPVQEFFLKNQLTLSNRLDQSFGAEKSLEYFFTSDTVAINKDFQPVGSHKFSTNLSVGYRSYANKNLDAKENDRAGFTYGVGGVHKMAIDNWVWMNSLTYSKLETVGKKFNTNDYTFVTNYQRIIFEETEAMLGFSYGSVSYPNSRNSRNDMSLGYSLELSRELFVKGLAGKLSFSRNKNKSDEEASNFTQDIISLWMSYDIL